MNNKEVIKYVKNNSKHPHAALIVEWLLTDCEVKVWNNSPGEWLICDYPKWSPDCKYLLVKPKPACRVYLRTTGYPATVERFPDGTYSPNYNENLEWLSDWIEYDTLPKVEWPNEYIQRIAEIDEYAAQWIVDNIKLNDPNSASLWTMFTWGKTPQGYDYWRRIDQTLNASILASS